MCEECYRLFGVETRTDSRMRFTELSPAFGGAFLMPNQAIKKADPPKEPADEKTAIGRSRSVIT